MTCPRCGNFPFDGKCRKCGFMKNKGQATIGEILLIIVLLTVICGAGYYLMSRTTQTNKFSDNAQQHQFTYAPGGIRLFDFSCVPRSIMDEWGKNVNKTTK